MWHNWPSIIIFVQTNCGILDLEICVFPNKGDIHFQLSKIVEIFWDFFKSSYVTPLSYVTCVRQDRHLWMGSFHTLPLVKSRLIDGSQEVGLARGISRVTIISMSSRHSIIIIIIMNIYNVVRAMQVSLNNISALFCLLINVCNPS